MFVAYPFEYAVEYVHKNNSVTVTVSVIVSVIVSVSIPLKLWTYTHVNTTGYSWNMHGGAIGE